MSSIIDRIRVLVLIKGLGIGGAETLIAEAAPYWDRDSFDYRVAYMLPWKDQLVPRLTEQGVAVESLGWRRPPGLDAVRRLRRLVADWRPHLVHSHLPAAGVLARVVVTGTPHVYTEHNVVGSYRPVTRALNRATYARNRAVIAVSAAVAASLDGYPGPRPRVVANGVAVSIEEARAAAARAELGVGPDDPLVVHVGNIRPHKGHDTLVEAAALVVSRLPEVTFVSIGGEKRPGDLARVTAMAERLGISERLRFLGRREDARSFLAAADVVVNPADVEGLPVSLLEAMALSRPVVATAVGGVPTLIVDSKTGLLVPPGDPQRLADALVRALTSPEAKRWGEEGARLVARDYGLDRMVHSYEDVYREVVGG